MDRFLIYSEDTQDTLIFRGGGVKERGNQG